MCLRGNHLHPNLQPWFCPATQLSAAPATAAEGLDGAPWKRLPGNRLVAVAPLGAPAYDVPDPGLAAKAGSTRVFPFGTVLVSPLSSRMHRGMAYWQLQLLSGAEPQAAGIKAANDALLAAAASGDLVGVKEHGPNEAAEPDDWADYRRTDTHGRSALLLAARHGFMEIVKWLATEEARGGAAALAACDLGGRTALHLAVMYGHVALTRWLCEKRAALVDAVSWPEVSPRQLRAGARQDAGARPSVEGLLRPGDSAGAIGVGDLTAIPPWGAAASMSASGAATLGAGWPCDRHTGQTALHLACLGGYVQTAAALLAAAPHSAQLTFRDAQGATPLMVAVTSGIPPEPLGALVQLLCDYGVEVDAGGGQLGCTALGLVVRWASQIKGTAPFAAEVLLQYGADPTLAPEPDPVLDQDTEQVRYTGEMGRPPLLAALYDWSIELVALLAPGGLIPLLDASDDNPNGGLSESDFNAPMMSKAARNLDAKLRSMSGVDDVGDFDGEQAVAEVQQPEYVLESEARLATMQADLSSAEERGVQARRDLREVREELARSAAEAFQTVDTDGSGTVDKTELKALCQELGIGINVRQLNAAWRFMDKDGDGRMELDEFDAWLFGDKEGDGIGGGDGMGARMDLALFNQFATGLNIHPVVQLSEGAKAEVIASEKAERVKHAEAIALREEEAAYVQQKRREEEDVKWRTDKHARIAAEHDAEEERNEAMFDALGGNDNSYEADGVTHHHVDVGHKLSGLLGNSSASQMSKKVSAMNAAGQKRHGKTQAQAEYAMRLKDLGVKTTSVDLSDMLPGRVVTPDSVLEARAKLHTVQMHEGRWIANLLDTEGRNGVHLCILSLGASLATANGGTVAIERNGMLLRLLAPLSPTVAKHAVTVADLRDETPLAMAVSAGLAECSGTVGRGWVDVCVTLVRYGAMLSALGTKVEADLRVQCATKPLTKSTFGGWLSRQLGREAQAVADRRQAAEIARRRRVRQSRPASAPAGGGSRSFSPSPYISAKEEEAAELEALLELNEMQLRRMKKCDKLAERAREREKQKRAEQAFKAAAFQAEVQRQSDSLRYGQAQAVAREKARRKKANQVKKLLKADRKIEELAMLAKDSEKERRATKLAAQMQKESGEEEGLTEVEWRKKTGERLAGERAAAQHKDQAAIASVTDLTVLADSALKDGVVPEDLYALNLAEEGSKLSRKEKAAAAQRLGQDRQARGHDDKLTMALLEYGFLTSGGELLKARKAKKSAESMAERALWWAKHHELEKAALLMEKQHLPPQEGALGPGTPRPGAAAGIPAAAAGVEQVEF